MVGATGVDDLDLEQEFLVEPETSCVDNLNQLPWEPTFAVDVAAFRVGIRASSAELSDVLQTLLRAHVVEDPETPVNFSVLLAGEQRRSRNTGFHFLYRGSNAHLRTRDPLRLVHGLVGSLSSLAVASTGRFQAVQGVALVGDSGAVIAPMTLREYRARFERRFALRGVRYVDLPWVFLDAARSEIVVPEPVLDLDWSVTDSITDLARAPRPEAPVPAGAYPLCGWAFFGNHELTAAQAVAIAARDTYFSNNDPQQCLSDLAAVVSGVQRIPLGWGEPSTITDPILEVVTNG
ncbi:MAG: hypothetical protein KDB02_15455 [Acidimicrobiales bacterium]|nr:hypothetical protein [Acidimicrobiales bacterium]